jgi:hypothetical protein
MPAAHHAQIGRNEGRMQRNATQIHQFSSSRLPGFRNPIPRYICRYQHHKPERDHQHGSKILPSCHPVILLSWDPSHPSHPSLGSWNLPPSPRADQPLAPLIPARLPNAVTRYLGTKPTTPPHLNTGILQIQGSRNVGWR